MKILQINSCFGCFSTGRIVADIAKEAVKQGHECLAAYRLAYLDQGIPTYKIGGKFGVKFNTLLARLIDRSGFGAKTATKRLLKKIEEFSPDIVHLHNLHGDYINIKLLFEYLEQKDLPVIITVHDCWLFTGHCAHFLDVGCEKWKSGCFKCPNKKGYPKSYFLDQSRRNFNQKKELLTKIKNLTIVSPSKWLADLVSQSFLKNAKIEIINNGIDLNVFKPSQSNFRDKYGINDKKMILGVASSWSAKKGLYDYFELAKSLDDNMVIVLVGLTEKQMRGLPLKIIGIPRTLNIKELARIYTAADVFVNLTHEDNFPLVNLEAQACGTPVITYNTGGAHESVTLETGLVVEPKKIDSIIEAIKSILYSDHNYRESCIKNVIENYDKNKQTQKYIKLYTT